MSTPSPATKTVKAEAGDDDGGGAFIEVKVESQNADDVWFRIKRNVKLRRLMDMYCSKLWIHPMAVQFLNPECRPIQRYQTADEVGLRDGDPIYVMLTHEGRAFITIKVHSETADDVVFRIKRDVKLRRLVDMYCGKHSLHAMAVMFLDPKGCRIRPDQTPDEVGLKNGDTIDVMLDVINIKVRSETAADALFRIKRDVKLQRLVDMYCGKHSLRPKSVRFLVDPEGRLIQPNQTDEVGLKDGDAIDIVLAQEGGIASEPEIYMTAAEAFPGFIRY